MKNIKIISCILILATLGIIVFSSPIQTQIASRIAEPEPFSCIDVTEIPQIECEALVAFYNVIPKTNRPFGWLETTTPCSWPDITCNNGHITELQFSSNQLSSLPSEISDLTNLTVLDLHSTDLSRISNPTNLNGLDLGSNQLSSLPEEIGNIRNLKEFCPLCQPAEDPTHGNRQTHKPDVPFPFIQPVEQFASRNRQPHKPDHA